MIQSIIRSWVVILVLVLGQLLTNDASYAALAVSKPLALVYTGPGACLSCWVSAAAVARKAGFKVKLVNQKLKDFSVFQKAKMWVQPGGKSRTAAQAMGEEYLQKIRDFVSGGGGYVGFCAGAFLATDIIGTSTQRGLGIIPGRTELWEEADSGPQITRLNWNGKERDVYYSGGPYIDLMGQGTVDTNIFAYYPDGKINAVTHVYGKGRVSVTGTHPEASNFWKFTRGQLPKDRDGSDQSLVVEMMKWVTQ